MNSRQHSFVFLGGGDGLSVTCGHGFNCEETDTLISRPTQKLLYSNGDITIAVKSCKTDTRLSANIFIYLFILSREGSLLSNAPSPNSQLVRQARGTEDFFPNPDPHGMILTQF